MEIPPRHTVSSSENRNDTRHRHISEPIQQSSLAATPIMESTDSVAAHSTNIIQMFDSSKASPYAQRRSASTSNTPMTNALNIVDDHYSADGCGADSVDGFSLDSVSIESGSISRFTVID